jgi:hypothetical protein
MLWWLCLIVSGIISCQTVIDRNRQTKKHLERIRNNRHPEIVITKAGKNEFPEILHLLKIAATNLQSLGIDQWSYWLDPPKERLDWAQKAFDNSEFHFINFNSQMIAMYRLCTEDLLYWGKQEEAAY